MLEFPVRVLHVANHLGLGGTEKVMQFFVANLDQKRFQPAVYSRDDGPRAKQIRQLGIPTYIGSELLSVLHKYQPHIVHVHRAGWPEPKLLTPIRRTRPHVVVETNVFGHHDPSPAASVIDATLFVSRFCLDRFAATNDITATPPRYDYLYNPVDTDFFTKTTRTDRDFSIPAAGRISRADPGKWSGLALEFVPHVVRDIPDFRYHIIGCIPKARKYLEDNGFADNVVLYDPVETDDKIAAFLDQVSVLAHANDTGESFGLVIAEAMACGLPVVTHPCEGLKDNAQLELVDDGVTGLVATTAEEYANALKYLFAHPEKARRMGQAGREKAHRLYRMQTVTRQLESLYIELLESKGIA